MVRNDNSCKTKMLYVDSYCKTGKLFCIDKYCKTKIMVVLTNIVEQKNNGCIDN
jgi:hypothetical protein